MTFVGVQLIDRRHLLIIGAIVGVMAGHINPVTQAVNYQLRKLIGFVCMCVFFSFLISLFLMLISVPNNP
jgi:uncharacterized membrane protein YdcZ (DUF606 family)